MNDPGPMLMEESRPTNVQNGGIKPATNMPKPCFHYVRLGRCRWIGLVGRGA